ncbi:MAG: hypothetical protein RML56_08405 [Burkholderiales bacterium]|nr:hypothetical protein [Burkholderiales bacterium]
MRWCATSAACSTSAYSFCDQIAKLVPFQPGRSDHARRGAAKWSPLLAERERNEEEVRDLLAPARKSSKGSCATSACTPAAC